MSTAVTLYQIEDDLAALVNTQEMVEDEQAQLAILDEIAQATEAALVKRRNTRAFILWLGAQQDLCDKELERIRALKQHYATVEERVRKYVAGIIEQFAPQPKKGNKKLECEPGVLSIAKNPDSIEISDEEAVPAKYRTLSITVPALGWDALVAALGQFQGFADFVHTIEKTDVKIDRAAIKRALQAGEDVPGADLKFGETRLAVK